MSENNQILLIRLLELVVYIECKTYFESDSTGQLVVVPNVASTSQMVKMGQVTKALENLKVEPTEQPTQLSSSSQLPPFVRALYSRLIHNIPLFQNEGSDYFRELDKHLVNTVPKLFADWMIACNWSWPDVAASIVPLFFHARNQVQVSTDYKDPWTRFLYPNVQLFLLRDVTSKCKGQDLDPNRVAKLNYLMASAEKAFKSFDAAIQNSLVKTHGTTVDPRFAYDIITRCDSIKDLPQVYQTYLRDICHFLACLLDYIFDSKERRSKFLDFLEKLPLSFVKMSLKVINPASIIEQACKLFLWSPSTNTKSLFQHVGAYLCEISNTEKKMSSIQLNDAEKKEIQDILSDAGLHGRDRDTKFAHTLKTKIKKVTKKHVQYARYYLRYKEKQQFLKTLGDKQVIDFIVLAIRYVPVMLNEFKAVGGDLSQIVGGFFDIFLTTIKALEKYDQDNGTDPDLFKTIISEIQTAIESFVETMYPTCRLLVDPKNQDNLLIKFVEWVVEEFLNNPTTISMNRKGEMYQNQRIGVGAGRTSFYDMASLSSIQRIVHQLTADEKVALEKEIQVIKGAYKDRLHSRDFPETPLVQGKVLELFSQSLFYELAGL